MYIQFVSQEIDMIAMEMENHSPTVAYLYKELGWKVFHKYIIQERVNSGYSDKVEYLRFI